MELDGSRQECGGHFGLKSQSSIDESSTEFLDGLGKASQGKMLLQNASVNSAQGLIVREINGEDTEVTL